MKKQTIILLLFTFVTLLVISCNQVNKNTDDASSSADYVPTELALLMREMFVEAELIKKQIENGEPISTYLNHEEILTAHATEPDKAASDEYKAFAKTYLKNMELLKKTEANEVSPIYDNMVAQCMSCHKALCPGPMVKIKKLY